MLSGVCFTRLLFNKFQRCVLSSSMQVTRMTFFLLLFPRCVSEGTLQHEVPLRSPIRSDLCARCVPFVTRPAIQKNSQRVVAASRQDNKGKFAFEIIFDYSKSHLMAMSNDSSGLKLHLNVTYYCFKNRSSSVMKSAYNFFLDIFSSVNRFDFLSEHTLAKHFLSCVSSAALPVPGVQILPISIRQAG